MLNLVKPVAISFYDEMELFWILHSIKMLLVRALSEMPWYIPKGIDIHLAFTKRVKSGKLPPRGENQWLIAANIY